MVIKTIVFALVTFLHDLFTVLWMGGLLVTVVTLLPVLKHTLGPGPQVKQVMSAFQARHSTWVYISMAGLVITGLLLSRRSPHFEGLFAFGNPYAAVLSIKHILVILMIGITLYRSRVLGRAPGGASPARERLNLRLLLVNAGLAVAVLLASGAAAALANPPA